MSTGLRIISLAILLGALGLGYWLIFGIYDTIDNERRIAEAEQSIIDQLMIIREAQVAHKSVTGNYAPSFEELIRFVKEDDFYLIDRKETIIDLGYGRDSIIVDLDTLGSRPVLDSLFNATRYPNLILDELARVPVWPEEVVTFELFTSKVDKGGVMVEVIEVVNPKPYDKTRDEDSNRPNRRFLRFGSRTDVTTAGNWE